MGYYINYQCISNIGKHRRMNQDNFICAGREYNPEYGEKSDLVTSSSGNGTDGIIRHSGKSHLGRKLLVFGVFDGMGGEEQGEMASYLAAKCASESGKRGEPVRILQEICFRANERIFRYAQQQQLSAMGTTAAMIAFGANGIGLISVGDSKIFHFSDGELRQISVDHVGAAPYGVKPPLTQYLGMDPEESGLEPYLARGNLQEEDIYLLCSDGLTDMLSPGEVKSILKTGPYEQVAERLSTMAMEKGGRDNTTILLCRVEKTGLFH